MQKEALPDGTAYVFRHRKLGILGRIRIQERAAGGSHLVAEVAGDPADPMTRKRAALFEPLARSVSALLPTDTGALGRADPPPPTPDDPGHVVRSERILCPECGEAVAFVTTAVDATDRSRLEDYAQRLYAEHARLNLPAWIVGPVRGQSSSNRGVVDVLPAWPARGPIVAMTGDQFDATIDPLVEGHYQKLSHVNPRKHLGSVDTAVGLVDAKTFEELEENFDTQRILELVDELDELRERVCDPDGLRADLLRLHAMAHTLVNGAPLTINADDQSIWELADDLESELTEIADNAKQAASIPRPLIRLAPE